MDLNAYLSPRGTANKGYATNVSCYAKTAVYTRIKLKGDKGILVKGKARNNSFRHGQGKSSVERGTENKGGSM